MWVTMGLFMLNLEDSGVMWVTVGPSMLNLGDSGVI